MPRRLATAVLAFAVTSLAGAPGASAASNAAAGHPYGEVGFSDPSSTQVNHVTVAQVGPAIRFEDGGTTIVAGNGCTKPAGDSFVLCPSANVFKVGANLFGGADKFETNELDYPLLLTAGPGADDITGGEGADVLYGDTGSDVLRGGFGDDVLADSATGGGDGSDQFYGEDGSDLIEGGALPGSGLGGDVLDGGGGSGADTVTYAPRTTRTIVTLDDTPNDGQSGEFDNVRGAEIVIGGGAGDSLAGGTPAETLYGGPGGDTISGGGGPDTLHGGTAASTEDSGDDVLDGGAGADKLIGGDGTDEAAYASRTAAVTVTLDNAANDGEPGENDRVAADVENATGGAAADTITGNGGANSLKGGGGRDTIGGAGGDDTIDGGEGGDILTGGSGDDVISGGDGDDSIAARDNSVDTISCQSGTDAVVADAFDNVAADCETVDRPPVAQTTAANDGGSTPGSNDGGNTPPPPAPPADTLAPVVTLSPTKLKLTAKGEAVITITCPATEPGGCSGTATLEALASKKPKIKKQTLGTANWKATAGQKVTLTIKLGSKARALVKKHKKVKSRLSVIACDTAGNTAPAVTRSILVQRR